MDEVIEFLVVAVIGLFFVFAMAIFGSLVGAFCGWVVGFTPLGTWILNFLSSAHIQTNMVDLGAFFGFIGGFFKETINVNKN